MISHKYSHTCAHAHAQRRTDARTHTRPHIHTHTLTHRCQFINMDIYKCIRTPTHTQHHKMSSPASASHPGMSMIRSPLSLLCFSLCRPVQADGGRRAVCYGVFTLTRCIYTYIYTSIYIYLYI